MRLVELLIAVSDSSSYTPLRMKSCLFLKVVVACAPLLLPAVTLAEDDDGFESIFDGETLEGVAALAALPAGDLEVVVGNYFANLMRPDDPQPLVRVPVTLTDGEDKLVEVVLGP